MRYNLSITKKYKKQHKRKLKKLVSIIKLIINIFLAESNKNKFLDKNFLLTFPSALLSSKDLKKKLKKI